MIWYVLLGLLITLIVLVGGVGLLTNRVGAQNDNELDAEDTGFLLPPTPTSGFDDT